MSITHRIQNSTKDPLFYTASILLCFWLADTYYKLFIFHSITQMFWWSSAGLFLTIISLYTKNSTLFTAMACALFLPEFIWSLSFLSNVLFHTDPFLFASYTFVPNFDRIRFFIGMYHILIIPAFVIGFFYIPLSRNGWVWSYVFGLGIAYFTYFFPDSYVNVNCTQALLVERCQFYFGLLYPLDPLLRIFLAASILTFCIFLPLNYVFLFLSKKYCPMLYTKKEQ